MKRVLVERRLSALLALFWCPLALAIKSLHCYRAPRGPDSQAWAVARASAFRGLDELSFPPNGLWSEKQYVRELTNCASDVLGVWDDLGNGGLIAFACVERVLDESHMLSLAVHPEWRGQGLARTLVLASLWAARAAGQRMLTLEVRVSNVAAIDLYRSCGLQLVGRRPKYYRSPPEDALLLTRYFSDEGEILAMDEYGPPPELETMMHVCGEKATRVIRAASTSAADEDVGELMDPNGLGALLGSLPVTV